MNGLALAVAQLNLAGDSLGIPIQQLSPSLRGRRSGNQLLAGGRLVYGSAIAVQLAQPKSTAPELARAILAHFPWPASADDRQTGFWDFDLSTDASGWIHCEFSDRALAAWLQQISQSPPRWQPPTNWLSRFPDRNPPPAPPDPANSGMATDPLGFGLQYAHARCCSLMRLADREGFMQLATPDAMQSPRIWRVIQPQPFPWLEVPPCLRFSHPAEQTLLALILGFPRSLAPGRTWQYSGTGAEPLESIQVQLPLPLDPDYLRMQLQQWRQGFEDFYAHCRIWGEVRATTPTLATTRLGLLVITQGILRFILADLLDLNPPLEL